MTFDNDSSDSQSTRLTNNTRRRFLAGSAGALGGLALGGAFATGSAFAHENDEDGGDEPPEENPTEGEFEDDIDVLNYALTLEQLEAEFYIEAFDNLDDDEIRGAETLDPFDGEICDRVVDDLQVVREHEVIHVETLMAVIEDLGGDPIERPEFDFGQATEDPDAFLATAQALENTGVSAYNGAIGSIESSDLQTAGATVATVEARHASFLNVLNGEIGFPRAFDRARSRSEVLEIAGDFIADDMDEMMGDDDDDDDN